jgi:hypothetical protein
MDAAQDSWTLTPFIPGDALVGDTEMAMPQATTSFHSRKCQGNRNLAGKNKSLILKMLTQLATPLHVHQLEAERSGG